MENTNTKEITSQARASKIFEDKSIRVQFRLVKDRPEDMELWEYLNSLVSQKSEIPGKVKEIVEQYKLWGGEFK